MARVQYSSEALEKRGLIIIKSPRLANGLKRSRLNAENAPVELLANLEPPALSTEKMIELYHQTGTHLYPAHGKWVFPVPPMPAPRLTQNQTKLVYIHDSALDRNSLRIKRRVLAYAGFKDALRLLANRNDYAFPQHGFHITFWFKHRLNKPELEATPHQNKPDLDNCLKAFKDALYAKDQMIWDYRVTKRWCIASESRIEVSLIS